MGATTCAPALTRKTTVTFSDSTTPESGSPSISSPGPGIARLSAERSNTFSLDADFLIAGFLDALDDSDRIELGRGRQRKPPETAELTTTLHTPHAHLPRLAHGPAAFLWSEDRRRPTAVVLPAIRRLAGDRHVDVRANDGLAGLAVEHDGREAP